MERKIKKTISKELDKLLKARFIREVMYPKWLANVIMVKKSNGKWCIYINFTNLKKIYLKDNFLLLKITKLMDEFNNWVWVLMIFGC